MPPHEVEVLPPGLRRDSCAGSCTPRCTRGAPPCAPPPRQPPCVAATAAPGPGASARGRRGAGVPACRSNAGLPPGSGSPDRAQPWRRCWSIRCTRVGTSASTRSRPDRRPAGTGQSRPLAALWVARAVARSATCRFVASSSQEWGLEGCRQDVHREAARHGQRERVRAPLGRSQQVNSPAAVPAVRTRIFAFAAGLGGLSALHV